jgi:type I restriction enzyme S subunit
MSENKFMKLSEVCHVYQPETIAKKSLPADGVFPVYGANGKIGFNDKYNHEEPQLLLGCRGSVGSIHISEPFSWINGNAMVVQPFEKIVTRDYLKYAFLGGINIKDAISGTAQPQITRESLSPIEIFVPTLEVQRKIVEKLDTVFTEIDLLEENLRVGEDKANQLLQSLLGAAFLTEEDNLERGSQLESQISALRDSYDSCRLSEVTEAITDGSHNPPKGIEHSNYLMLSSRNIFNDSINLEKVRYLSEKDFTQEDKRTNLKDLDVLLTIVGTIGRAAVFNSDLGLITLQRSVAVIRPNQSKLNSRFLMYSLQSMLSTLLSESRGVAQQGFYLDQLRNLNILVPPLNRQREIVEKLDRAHKEIESTINQIAVTRDFADMLRQSLLSEAFSPTNEVVSI